MQPPTAAPDGKFSPVCGRSAFSVVFGQYVTVSSREGRGGPGQIRRHPNRHSGKAEMNESTAAGALSATPRTTLRRGRDKGRVAREDLYAVLRAAFVCHLGIGVDGVPMVVPTIYGF